jgi:glycosyltransferase involved in cell wall biosynthesis
MRILFVLASRGAGGAEILVRDLAVELRDRGVDVGIAFVSRAVDLEASPEFEADYQRALTAKSIATFDLGHECRRSPVRGSRRLHDVITQFQPDVVHIHLQYGLLFRLLLWPRRIRTIYTHHIDRFRKGRMVFRLLSFTVDHFIAISHQTERLLRSAVGDRVTRIMNAVRFPHADAPRRMKSPMQPFQILSAGGLYPQKDYPTLVRVATRLLADRPDLSGRIRFLLAGGGPEREPLEQQISDARLDSTIVLLGTRTDVPQLMAQSDLLLMTSAYEGLPITLIEAMHAGLPLVATDVGGCSEIVDHGHNGFLAGSGDETALARYVQNLIDDPDLRLRFSRASKAKAQQFSMAANAEHHLALYRRVLQCNGA